MWWGDSSHNNILFTQSFCRMSGITAPEPEYTYDDAIETVCDAFEYGYTLPLYDMLADVRLKIAPAAFYQVNRAAADMLYRKAAELGNRAGLYNLGYSYAYGKGVDTDYSEAFRCFSQAAERDHAASQYELGRLYEFGRGVAMSMSTAIEWYKKAAAQGNDAAKKRLSSIN